MRIITMHGVNLWEVDSFNLAVWGFFTKYNISSWKYFNMEASALQEGRSACIIQCDNNRWADNHLSWNSCRCFVEESQFWHLFMNGQSETVYHVIQLSPNIHLKYLFAFFSSFWQVHVRISISWKANCINACLWRFGGFLPSGNNTVHTL